MGNGTVVSSGNVTVYNYTPPITMNASNATLSIASNYAMSKLGRAYFSNYIGNPSGFTYIYSNGTNTSVIFYSYMIPFSNGTTTRGIVTSFGGALAVALLGVDVVINNGNVASYVGPNGPYIVSITRDKAMQIANQYGLVNATNAYITAAWGSNPRNYTAGYQVVWGVTGTRQPPSHGFPDGRIYGVYINVSSGAVVGEYSINPAILAATGPGAVLNSSDFMSSGNFGLFQPTSSYQQQKLPNGTMNQFLVVIALIIIISAFGVIVMLRRKQR